MRARDAPMSTSRAVTSTIVFLGLHMSQGAQITPGARADEYHDDFADVSKVFRGLRFAYNNESVGSIIADTGSSPTKGLEVVKSDGRPYEVKLTLDAVDNGVNEMSVNVMNLPTDGVTGCQPLASFYTEVRDKLVSTLPYSIDQMEENTGDQQELEGVRRDIENAQLDVHAIEVFCGDLANMLRIRRNVYHAYTSAWGQIEFGDGTLPRRRMLQAGSRITLQANHEDVLRYALKQMEHEPDVALALLRKK